MPSGSNEGHTPVAGRGRARDRDCCGLRPLNCALRSRYAAVCDSIASTSACSKGADVGPATSAPSDCPYGVGPTVDAPDRQAARSAIARATASRYSPAVTSISRSGTSSGPSLRNTATGTVTWAGTSCVAFP